MTDLTSPRVLKFKAGLFVFLGLLAGTYLLLPIFTWPRLLLFGLAVWAFSRAYHFCFYVLQHYVDPEFRYSGLGSALAYLLRGRPRN